MGNRQGTLLEKNVDKIFSTHGFITKRNFHLNGYEIDVYARRGKDTIIIQCKQYERSYINVKDLIHQWASKKNEVGASRMIIVIYGQNLTPVERQLAKRLDVTIWDEHDLDKIERMQDENFYNYLKLNNASIIVSTESMGSDIALIVVGVLLSPILVGLPIFFYGLYRLIKHKATR
jgi:Holliday junction resolvase